MIYLIRTDNNVELFLCNCFEIRLSHMISKGGKLMLKMLGFIALLFFSMSLYKKVKGEQEKKERQKILLKGGVIILVLLYLVFGLGTVSEAEYFGTLVNTSNRVDNMVKQTDVYSNSDMKDTAKLIDKEVKKINKITPPKSLPKSLRDSHKTYVDGLKTLRDGIRKSDTELIQKGQTMVSISEVLFYDYLESNPEVVDKAQKYID